jgi:uncharacterized damage-inducible protein DinB
METTSADFFTIPDPPETVSAGTILGRLADGIGFRYRWATEGISAVDLTFRPAEGCMSLGELLSHVLELLSWLAQSLGLPAKYELLRSADPDILRARTLELAAALAARFKAMTESEVAAVRVRSSKGDRLPVWNIINGPLSDSLTHIGQILAWRRIAGSPPPPADVFRGCPPQGRTS